VDTHLDHKVGRTAELTLTPSHLPGGPGPETIQSATVQVAYDDGTTWVDQPVKKTADGWRTQLDAPAGAEHVTLRAGATDSAGNSVEQTIDRAFGLR